MSKFLKYKIEQPSSVINTNQYAEFEIGPLEQGFGLTLGTALRRVLLSSIPGAAIFAIKIPNVNHEHSVIKGVIEDVSHIILNVKKLIISIDTDITGVSVFEETDLEKWPVLKINVREKGVIYAKDVICPLGFKILNPDAKICELTVDRNFTMELYATISRGFRNFHENREIVSSLNVIAIDSMFSPVINAFPEVQENKTSKKGISDSLIMKIATNGTISPSNALAYAAKIWNDHLAPIINLNPEYLELEMLKDAEQKQKRLVLSTPIDELELSMRSFNCLKRAGIHTIQELINKSKSELEKIRNLGKKSLKEILRKISERNLTLRDDKIEEMLNR